MSLMRRLALLYFLLLVTHCASAQSGADSAKNDLLFKLQRDLTAYKQAVSSHDTAGISESCYLIAKRQIALGNYAQAQKLLLESIQFQKPERPSELTGKVYLRMQEIQFILGNYQQALKYCRIALQSFKAANSNRGYMSVYSAMGACHLLAWEVTQKSARLPSQTLLDSAIYYNTKSLAAAKALNSAIDIGLAHQQLGRCWFFKNEPAKNLFHKKAAMEIYSRQNLSNNSLEIKNLIAMEFLSQNDPVSAKKWLDAARAHEEKRGTYIGMKITLEQCYAQYYEQIHDWKAALSSHKKINDLKQAHLNQYRSETVEGIRKTYDYQIKELQIKANKKEISLLQNADKTKTRLLAGSGILLLIALAASVLYGFLYVKYKAVSAHNQMLIKEQSHRTKNSLQAISALLNLQLFKSTEPLANLALEESLLRIEAINLVHQKLHQTELPLFIDLRGYITELIENILVIHQKKIHFSCQLDSVLLHAEKAVPFGLIINELTTNACKYAFVSKQAELSIACHYRADRIYFEFKDNGKGFNPKQKQAGFGLDLIENLAVQLKGSSEFMGGSGCDFRMSFPVSDHFIVTNSTSAYSSAG
ncbi:sensor histidine kinase [Dyadobacter psychrotolerans]|uniref:histidine kinase n=1 Tax=Dyadobacter psychrotolerans TaxID=2541721 RepID=A0A4R5D8S1_9BACT|nr:sensor histidine kinase [Dyadobacter psychrotolerans]TDE08290.1 sensor histidine kinase [Dyadobacter psychrotolerans]